MVKFLGVVALDNAAEPGFGLMFQGKDGQIQVVQISPDDLKAMGKEISSLPEYEISRIANAVMTKNYNGF